jgi:hypothetical protein
VGGLLPWLLSVPRAQYTFESRWVIENAQVGRLFEILARNHYEEWWPEVLETRELGPGRLRSVVKSALPYKLTMDIEVGESRVDPSRGTLKRTFGGDLAGDSTWELEQAGPHVYVDFIEHAATTSKLFNLLAPLSAPLMRWNHEQMMQDGQQGLQMAANGCPNPAEVLRATKRK